MIDRAGRASRFQVFVEAVILEVSISRDRTLGVGWHGGLAPVIGGEQTPIIFSNTPNSDLSSLNAAINPLNLASLLGLAGAVSGPTLGGTESIVPGGIPSIGVVLQALQSTNDVNVVSTPHLLTVDNEEAEIQVNEKRPFPSGLSLGANLAGGLAGAANNQATAALGNLGGLGLGQVSFNREDVGLTLKLKPQINDEDYVRLEIDQELSDVAGIDQVTNQVITSKRSAKTTVVVRSQDSVVIGGLVRDRETIDEAKTPLLGDLPLIGWLFKRQQRVVEKTNLLLILTPYIIRGPSDFRRIFERKMAERKEFVDRFYGTSSEYRASIDWDRKVGPLGSYHFRMASELQKIENDGPGQAGEQLIQPDDDSDDGSDNDAPSSPASAPSSGGAGSRLRSAMVESPQPETPRMAPPRSTTQFAHLAGRPFGEIAIAMGFVEIDDVTAALDAQQIESDDERVGELLVQTGRLNAEQVARVLSVQLEMPFLDKIEVDQIPDDLVQKVPISFARQHGVLPVARLGDSVMAAVQDPVDTEGLDDVAMLLQSRVIAVIALHDTIADAINRVYDRATGLAHEAVAQLQNEDEELEADIDAIDLLDDQGGDDAPIIRFVNALLRDAVKSRASDIHIESFEAGGSGS